MAEQNALLAWSGFAFILAYTYGLRLLLAGGILVEALPPESAAPSGD